MGLGQLIVNLTTLCNSTDERVTAIFHLDKNCEGEMDRMNVCLIY